jgi:type I restriction enzyme S subunit
MATLQPYKKYNSVAYDYATELPDGWQLWKIAHAFNLIGSGTTPQSGNISFYESGTINWINTGDLNDGVINECKNKITELAFKKHSVLKIYPKGTLLVAMYGATIGKAAVMNLEGCTNQACCALSKSKILTNKFTLYWFIANRKNIVNLSYGGGQPNISQDVIKKLKIPVPPLEVQNSIVAYLDKKNSEIDKFIRNKERLVELLELNRHRKIFDAITKGIDKNIELKESGIEWFGLVPKFWIVTRAKFVSKIFIPDRDKPELNFKKNGIPWVTTEIIGAEILEKDNLSNYVSRSAFNTKENRVLPKNSVVATCVGSFGITTYIPFECFINQQLQAYTDLKINPFYLRFIIQSSENYFVQNATQTTLMYVNKQKFSELPVLFPTMEEQDKIVVFVNEFNEEINSAISKAQKEISSIKEYREALITDLVTGKRSVQQV